MERLRTFWTFKKELLVALRPHTGLYAFVLVIAGFRLTDGEMSWLMFACAAIFALITCHIMFFNDIEDRDKDRPKADTFVRNHLELMLDFHETVSWLIVLSLLVLSLGEPRLAGVMVLAWGLGILYSLAFQKFYIFQNFIVALCSAMPLICGAFVTGRLDYRVMSVFVALGLLIFAREIMGDIRDKHCDRGFKDTIPIRTEDSYQPWVNGFSIYGSSCLLPRQIIEATCVYLCGDLLVSLRVVSSLVCWVILILLLVLGWRAVFPLIPLVSIVILVRIALAVDEASQQKWEKRIATGFNLSIAAVLLSLLL